MTFFLFVGVLFLVIAALLVPIGRKHPGEPFSIERAWRGYYVWRDATAAAKWFALIGGVFVGAWVMGVL